MFGISETPPFQKTKAGAIAPGFLAEGRSIVFK